jgi:homoserine kinase
VVPEGSEGLKAVVAVTDFAVSTGAAGCVLPGSTPIVTSLQRRRLQAALLGALATGEYDPLRVAMQDRGCTSRAART